MPSTSRILAVLSILSVTLATTGGPAAGSFFTISPKAFPSLCAVPSGSDDGTNIALADCNSCDAEWSFDGKSIHHVSSSKCWDVTDGGQWNSNKPQLWDCYAWNGNQMWNMANGLVKWATNDFCMDLTDGVGQTGTVLQIWQCFTGNENQQWVITELEDDDSSESSFSFYLYHESLTLTSSPQPRPLRRALVRVPPPAKQALEAIWQLRAAQRPVPRQRGHRPPHLHLLHGHRPLRLPLQVPLALAMPQYRPPRTPTFLATCKSRAPMWSTRTGTMSFSGGPTSEDGSFGRTGCVGSPTTLATPIDSHR